MDETHCRKIVTESRLAACALVAAGETFRPLLHNYRRYADAIHEIAALADKAAGERRQQLAGQLQAMFHIVNEALANRTETARQAHAERLQISVEEVDARLYPPLPTADADDATKKAYERSIHGQADRWRRLGLAALGQDRGHAFSELVRTVWLMAPSRAEIDRFLERLDELTAVYARSVAPTR
ncbi:hypothetical protein [Nonomuraea sp. LPB2021202275-12-8]|uniref:hypothetical protein n=1 Tax=Nonomuraea sp. LPB2021202275-12-8 TaxID=3120159 RepID=UPI00300D4923